MKRFILSFDDGTRDDLRMAELLRQYQLPAIFYIPSNCELSAVDIENLSDEFEIGSHTVNHPSDMKLLDSDSLKYEIEDNKLTLEEITKKKITSFAYPRGRYDNRVKQAVISAGFKEARTVKVFNTEMPFDKFEIVTTLHLTYPRAEYKDRDVFELARWYVDGYAAGHFDYLHFWGHSAEVSKFGNWRKIEELFKYVNSKGIWYSGRSVPSKLERAGKRIR